MKKYILLVLLVPALVGMIGCGGSKTDDKASFANGMREVQLKINGTQLSIIVPDSSKGKLEIVEQSWGATEIRVGKNFQLSVSESEGDIALSKSDIAGNDVNKFKRYIIDQPDLLFWESQITEPEFHFYFVNKLGTVSYLFEDIKGDMFSEKLIQAMIDAAKSLKVVAVTKPNS